MIHTGLTKSRIDTANASACRPIVKNANSEKGSWQRKWKTKMQRFIRVNIISCRWRICTSKSEGVTKGILNITDSVGHLHWLNEVMTQKSYCRTSKYSHKNCHAVIKENTVSWDCENDHIIHESRSHDPEILLLGKRGIHIKLPRSHKEKHCLMGETVSTIILFTKPTSSGYPLTTNTWASVIQLVTRYNW